MSISIDLLKWLLCLHICSYIPVSREPVKVYLPYACKSRYVSVRAHVQMFPCVSVGSGEGERL